LTNAGLGESDIRIVKKYSPYKKRKSVEVSDEEE